MDILKVGLKMLKSLVLGIEFRMHTLPQPTRMPNIILGSIYMIHWA